MKKIIGAALTASMAIFVNNTMAEVRNITDGAKTEEVRPDTPLYTRARQSYQYTPSYEVDNYEAEDVSIADFVVEPVAPSAEIIDVRNSVNTDYIPTQSISAISATIAPHQETTTAEVSSTDSNLTNDVSLSLEKLEKMFNVIDNNSDGFISKGEFIDFHDKVMRKKAERAEGKAITTQQQQQPIFNKPMGRVDLP